MIWFGIWFKMVNRGLWNEPIYQSQVVRSGERKKVPKSTDRNMILLVHVCTRARQTTQAAIRVLKVLESVVTNCKLQSHNRQKLPSPISVAFMVRKFQVWITQVSEFNRFWMYLTCLEISFSRSGLKFLVFHLSIIRKKTFETREINWKLA